jgi:hypothetical protein
LKKLKDILHMIVEGSGSERRGNRGAEAETDEVGETEIKRRQVEFMKKIAPILGLLSPAKIKEYFGTEDQEAI